MAEITEQVQKLVARDAELAAAMSQLEVKATDHEAAAREARMQRDAAKREREQIRRALNDARVVEATQSAEAQAKKAAAEAQDVLRRLEEKEKALDEAIAKATAAPATPDAAVAPTAPKEQE